MKVVKGIGKAIKGVVNGVKKVFKEITKSKIGKALLLVGAIYLGGAAFGMWNSPFASVNGAFTAAGSQASQAAATQAAAGGAPVVESVPSFVAAGGDAAAATVDAAAAGTAGSAASTSANAIAGTAQNIPGAMESMGAGTATNAASSEAGKGIVSKLLETGGRAAKSIGSFAKENPTASIIALNTAAGMASPDEIDLMKKQQEQEEEDRARREKNLQVAGIDLGLPKQQQTLTDINGQPVYNTQGIIANRMLRS